MAKGGSRSRIDQNGYSASRPFTVPAEEVPRVMRIPFILDGYRILHQPWSFYVKSCVSLHNETFNFWTHFVGGVVVFIEALRLTRDHGSKWPMECQVVNFYTASSIIMHLASAATHLLHSRSVPVHLALFMCDYSAISTSAVGISLTVFSFCAPPDYAKLLFPYVLPLSILNAVAITAVFCHIFMTRRRQYTSLIRVIMFVPTCLFYAWTFWTFLYQIYCKFIDPNAIVQMWHVGHMLVLGFSFSIYATRLPERIHPGRYDICGNSHQLFHGLVSLSQILIIWAVRSDIDNDSPYLFSRQQHALSINQIWMSFIFVCFANLFLSGLYFHLHKREDDATAGIEYKRR